MNTNAIRAGSHELRADTPRPSSARPAVGLAPTSARPTLLVALTGFVVLSALAMLRHDAFATGRHDLEIYSQVGWNLANGAPFATTLLRTNTLHLAEHLALVLLPISPLYGLIPDPRVLIATQQLALCLSVAVVGLWAQRRLGRGAGLLLTLAMLLAPMLASVAFDDVHPIVLTTPIVALAFVQGLSGHWRTAALLALSAALFEEEASLAMAGIALVMIARRPRFAGLGLLGVSGVLLGLAVAVVMPGFHDPQTLQTADGNRTASHFETVRSQPGVARERLAGQRGRDAVLQLLLPTGGLSALSPGLLLGAVPTTTTLLLQDRDDTFTRHWAAPIFPVLWLATIQALAAAQASKRKAGVGMVLAGTLAAYVLTSPMPGGGRYAPEDFASGDREQALARAVALVPRGSSVAASANVISHLANRPAVYVYPMDEQYAGSLGYDDLTPDAYVLDMTDPDTQRIRPLSKRSPLVATPPFVIQSTAHKVIVLQRASLPAERPFEAQFGRSLALRGYDVRRSDGVLRLTLHWESTFEFASDIRRIVTVLDPGDHELAADGELELTRTFSTQKWPVGQQVLDEVELRLPTGAGDQLRARIQWRNRDQNRPYKLRDGSDSVDIPL
ncbi:MAG: DUF2079 domain-containing protein [Chloroflexi bacterium]|nr:DUF2079 domain-containing protein [Chloroflexota bacterium]